MLPMELLVFMPSMANFWSVLRLLCTEASPCSPAEPPTSWVAAPPNTTPSVMAAKLARF
ncbi:hypothetical protein D3C83_258750 [compost metagenome]